MTDYRCIAMDPPWLERGGGKSKRGADRHYDLLPTPDIVRVIRMSGVVPDPSGCHVWCWVTTNYLPDGLRVFRELSIRYVRSFVWVKEHEDKLQMGLGQYARGAHELCLFGVVGDGIGIRLPTASTVLDVHRAPRTKHSRKPLSFYADVVEKVSPGPRVELFAREPMHGWSHWGNEVD